MPILPVNKKTFNVSNRNRASFKVLLDGFEFAASLFFKIRNSIRITFNSKAISNFILLLRVSRVRLLISNIKLIGYMSSTISVSRVRMLFIFGQLESIAFTITQYVPLTFVSRTIQKLIVSLNIKGVLLNTVTTLASFYTLGDFDPTTLATQDSKTLEEMDFSS